MDALGEQVIQHLKNGGVVQISTYLKSWVYTPKHLEQFKVRDGNLYVKQGKHWNCLTLNGRAIVNIRFGRYR